VRSITRNKTYKCAVYYIRNGNKTFLGSASITLTNSLGTEGSYTLVINNGIQTFKYNEKIEEWRKNTHVNIAAYDRLWALMFHDDSIFKKEEELRKKHPYPTKKYLSEESRKKVIEG